MHHFACFNFLLWAVDLEPFFFQHSILIIDLVCIFCMHFSQWSSEECSWPDWEIQEKEILPACYRASCVHRCDVKTIHHYAFELKIIVYIAAFSHCTMFGVQYCSKVKLIPLILLCFASRVYIHHSWKPWLWISGVLSKDLESARNLLA